MSQETQSQLWKNRTKKHWKCFKRSQKQNKCRWYPQQQRASLKWIFITTWVISVCNQNETTLSLLFIQKSKMHLEFLGSPKHQGQEFHKKKNREMEKGSKSHQWGWTTMLQALRPIVVDIGNPTRAIIPQKRRREIRQSVPRAVW